jgi:hypothetical protein
MTTAFAPRLRRALGLAAAVLLTALLSACLVTSKEALITDDEAVLPFDPAFTMTSYKAGEDGTFTPTDDAPLTFTASGKAYDAGDKSMVVRFSPLEGEGMYLLTITGKDPGAFYGIGQLRDGIFIIRMILGSGADKAIEAAKTSAPADVAADITASEGGVEVSKRATLDYVVGLLASGTLPADPLVAYLAAAPSAATPKSIVKDGDWYRAQ